MAAGGLVGEGLGAIGLFAMVSLYLILFTRGFRAARGTRDAFGKLLACGLSFVMAVQCFIIMPESPAAGLAAPRKNV